MKILLTFFLLLTALTGFGQAGTPAKRLLARAWKAHVPSGTLKTLAFVLNRANAEHTNELDTVGFLRSMGVPEDSMTFARQQIKDGPDLSIPPRYSESEYFGIDFTSQRFVTIRHADGNTDRLKWVIRDGNLRAWYTPTPVRASLADWFSLGIASPTLLVHVLHTTDSVRYLGGVPFRGESYDALEVRSQKQTHQFYFDPQTALLRYVVVHIFELDPDFPLSSPDLFLTYTYEKYRRLKGVPLPQTFIEETAFDPYSLIRTTIPYGPVTINGSLPARLFVF